MPKTRGRWGSAARKQYMALVTGEIQKLIAGEAKNGRYLTDGEITAALAGKGIPLLNKGLVFDVRKASGIPTADERQLSAFLAGYRK
jgi:hypothetical protein